MAWAKRRLLVSALILIMAFALAACDSAGEKSAKPSRDWSRGLALGEGVTGSIGLLVEGNGDRTHLVWPYKNESGAGLAYRQLDSSAELAVTRELNFPGQLKFSRLVSAGDGRMHLLWTSRESAGSVWSLWHVLLDGQGQADSEPEQLSPDADDVGVSAAASDGEGGAVLVWDQGAARDLKVLHLGPGGEVLTGAKVVTDRGKEPSLRVDREGIAHLAWKNDRNIGYASIQIEGLETIRQLDAVDLTVVSNQNSLGDILEGPSLGVADGWVYIFWSILSIADTQAGWAYMDYVTFPVGAREPSAPARVWTIAAEDQPYVPAGSGFALTEIVRPIGIHQAADQFGRQVVFNNPLYGDWVDVAGAVSRVIMNAQAMMGDGEQLALAMSITQEKREAEIQQIAAGIFSRGEFLGYSIASATPYLSGDPVLAADPSGNLHVAWREGASGRGVYFASTSPAMKASLDRFTLRDVALLATTAGTEGIASLVFFPVLTPCWILPGLALLGLWRMRYGQRTLKDWVAWVPFVGAIAVFFVAKLLFLPTILTYTPFSAWTPIPDGAETPVRILAPLLIFLVSVGAAGAASRRFSASPPLIYLIIVSVDSMLTLSIYGVNLMGAV